MASVNEINELVDVLTISKGGKGIVMPIYLKWKGRKYRLSVLGLMHPRREGRVLHYVFEVTDGSLAFKLDYNTESLQWTLLATSNGLPN